MYPRGGAIAEDIISIKRGGKLLLGDIEGVKMISHPLKKFKTSIEDGAAWMTREGKGLGRFADDLCPYTTIQRMKVIGSECLGSKYK